MGRSSSISADLYSDLAFGLGIRNYPKLTPHLLKYFQWFQSYREVLQGWPSKGLEGLGPNLSLFTYKIHILKPWVVISRCFPKANFFLEHPVHWPHHWTWHEKLPQIDLKYIKWLPSYEEVFINVSWCVYWLHWRTQQTTPNWHFIC